MALRPAALSDERGEG